MEDEVFLTKKELEIIVGALIQGIPVEKLNEMTKKLESINKMLEERNKDI